MAPVVFERMCQGFVGVPDEEIVNDNHYSRLVELCIEANGALPMK